MSASEADDDPARVQPALFAALASLLAHTRAAIPPAPPPGAALAVVHAAALVLDAVLVGEPPAIERATTLLGARLDKLPATDPQAVEATAWADLALARVALLVGDLHVARSRFETVAAVDGPITLRVDAMLELAGLAIERADVETARRWARKATALATTRERTHDLRRARRIQTLIAYATRDVAAMQTSLDPDDPIEQLLQATTEPPPQAFERLATILQDAAYRGDALVYALIILVGARMYAGIGRSDDACLTLEAGRTQLRKVAPHLAKLLDREWGAMPA